MWVCWLIPAVALAALAAAGTAARADMRYRARITGAGTSQLADLLNKVSELKQLEDQPPASEEALRHRIAGDLARLADAAHSLGYWQAQFSDAIDTKKRPAKVTVTVTPGPLYHVAAVEALQPDGRKLPLAASLPLKPGDPARTAPVVVAEQDILAALGHAGHPFAKIAGRRVVIDRAAHTMRVTYRVAPGPVMRFGRVVVEGLKRLSPSYVERRVRWQAGEAYDSEKVAATRQALLTSGLFSTVRLAAAADPGHPGRVRMTIALGERAHRTVGAGIAYNTSEGAGARVFWEDRDLFGHAERLNLTATFGQQTAGIAANFRRPDTFATDQDLLALAEIADDTPTAYHSRRVRFSTGLERRFDHGLTGDAGISVERANVVELAEASSLAPEQRTQHYALLGLPLAARLDTTNDLLNPARGYRASLAVTPYQSFSGPQLSFVANRITASTYRQLGADGWAVVAGRVALSSIEGASLAALPADKRIYAGGGGSVRAYAYQTAGALDADKKPIGGRSSLEFSLEVRLRITDRIGLVPFLDAGSYYDTSLPHLGGRLLYGPGIGLRYYTAFGPIRLDLATPLNTRPGDSPIQVYISLGQAF
jgi:translocation and assembly module TamA